MERIGDRAAHDAARRADPVLAPQSTRLLRPALALALLVPDACPSGAGSAFAAFIPAASARQASQDLPPALATRFSEGVAALSAGQLDAAEAAFRAVIRGRRRPRLRPPQPRHRPPAARTARRCARRVPRRLASRSGLRAVAPARRDESVGAGSGQGGGGRARSGVQADAARAGRAPAACRRVRAHQGRPLPDRRDRTLVELSPANPEYAYRLGKAYLRLSQSAHAGSRRSIRARRASARPLAASTSSRDERTSPNGPSRTPSPAMPRSSTSTWRLRGSIWLMDDWTRPGARPRAPWFSCPTARTRARCRPRSRPRARRAELLEPVSKPKVASGFSRT